MDGKRFDDITEALATGASRRRVLKLLGGGVAGGLGLGLGGRRATRAAPGGNSACAKLCASLFPPGKQRSQCLADGAKGTGPCACIGVDCSFLDSACTVGVCSGGVCSATNSNDSGACTTAAGAAGTCSGGACVATDPLCAGVDCSSVDSTCTVGVCSGGGCSVQATNDSGACTTASASSSIAGVAGTCSGGACVANGGT